MSDPKKAKKKSRQQVFTLLVQIGRKEGDGLPDKATGAALMCFASGVDEAEAVRETVAILKQADTNPLDVTGYGTMEEREADGQDISDEERAEALEAVTHVRKSEVVSRLQDSNAQLESASNPADSNGTTSPPNAASSAISKVRLQLETGRTHQIRIHLSEAGHPICGDKIYGAQLEHFPEPARQALHSESLTLIHPFTGETLKFHMPLPQDLKHWLAKLQPATSN